MENNEKTLNWMKEQIEVIPNDVEIIWGESYYFDGVEIREFRFDCLEFENGYVSIYGILGMPSSNTLHPAILHIHGGGQTVFPDEVSSFVKKGYACMSFDWTGIREDQARDYKKISHYPSGFESEIMLPFFYKQFVAIRAARMCLSILCNQKEVDENNIGIYGVSWGGYITWIVNALEDRINCAVPIYGTGGLYQKGHMFEAKWPTLTLEEKKQWIQVMEPLKYMKDQKSPVLHLNATNDFFGGFDTIYEILPNVLVKTYLDLSANSNHHISFSSAGLMDKFFSKYLKGEGYIEDLPKYIIEWSEENKIRISIEKEPSKLEIWYSEGEKSHNTRCYLKRNDWEFNKGVSEMEFLCNKTLWILIKVYSDGVSQSIPCCINREVNENMDIEKKETKILFEENQLDGLGIFMKTEHLQAGDPREIYTIDDEGLKLSSLKIPIENLILRTPALDETKRYPYKSYLVFVTYNATKIEVVAKSDRKNMIDENGIEYLELTYTCKIDDCVDGENLFCINDFTDDEGNVLENANIIDYLIIKIEGDDSVCLKKIFWK